MEDNPDIPHSPAAPKPSPNEIDDLLAEAEALSNEIASGAVATVEAPPAHLEAERFLTESDQPAEVGEATSLLEGPAEPMQAVEEVQAKVDDLKDLLNDPDGSKPANDARTMALQSDVEATKPKSKKGSKFNLTESAVEKPAEAPAPQTARVELNVAIAPATADANETPAATKAVPVAAAAGTVGLKKFFGKIVRRAVDGMKSVVAAILNSVLAVLAVLDWPFRAMSPRVKSALGLAGLVTLFMGIMSWVMPGMMDSNPFEHMDMGIATKGGNPPAAAEGHSGEAAPAAEHSEAPAAQHH